MRYTIIMRTTNRVLFTLFITLQLSASAYLTGCSRVATTTLKTAMPRASDCWFDIYTSDREVPRRFETLCIVESYTAQGSGDDTTMSGAIKLARPKLCECGADAAILLYGSSAQVSGWSSDKYTPPQDLRGNAVLKGIRFVD